MEVAQRQMLNKFVLFHLITEKYSQILKLCHYAKKNNRTRIWRQPMYTEEERHVYGFFDKLFLYMKTDNEPEFRKATRMGVSTFNLLLKLIEKNIIKQDFVRESIPAECRLAITLVYLSHGVCRQMLAWSFRVGVSTVAKIIYETCEAIWNKLRCVYLDPPNDGEWHRIAQQYLLKKGMPNVLGAIDGKHIEIKCPPRSGSQYFNYKQYFSIILLAICDSEYTFTAVDIGAYGSQSDGGVLQLSTFGQKILNGTINEFEPTNINNVLLPYYFIGDSAFPLKQNVMRPYAGRNLPSDKENFNKRLSRARVTIENTFGILTAKWRVLIKTLEMNPKNAENIVKATVILHNLVIFHESDQYLPENYVDQYQPNGDVVQGIWRQEVQPLQQVTRYRTPNSSRNAFAIRDTLKDFLLHN